MLDAPPVKTLLRMLAGIGFCCLQPNDLTKIPIIGDFVLTVGVCFLSIQLIVSLLAQIVSKRLSTKQHV